MPRCDQVLPSCSSQRRLGPFCHTCFKPLRQGQQKGAGADHAGPQKGQGCRHLCSIPAKSRSHGERGVILALSGCQLDAWSLRGIGSLARHLVAPAEPCTYQCWTLLCRLQLWSRGFQICRLCPQIVAIRCNLGWPELKRKPSLKPCTILRSMKAWPQVLPSPHAQSLTQHSPL